MRPRQRVLTRKGQVTLPAEMRGALGLKEGDKVVVTLKGNVVQVARIGSVVERTAGMIKRRGRRLSVKQLREAAEQAIADDVHQRMNQ